MGFEPLALRLPYVCKKDKLINKAFCLEVFPFTGKSLSEALLFTEPGENMLCTEIVLIVKNNFCTQHVLSLEFS